MTTGTILTAAERIEEKYGGKWEKAGSSILKPPPAIHTGSILLDQAIGECKGWPEGSIIEAYGPQHSGKTLLGYLAISASQKAHPGRDHLLIDAENQFKFQALWAKQVGVNVEDLFVTGVTSAEEAFDKIEMAIVGKVELDKEGSVRRVIQPGNFGVILIDSVTQLVPLEMVHKSMEDKTRMAMLASVMSHGLKKVVSAMSLAKSKTILIFINQTRANIGKMFGNKETRTGGTALPFYDTIALRVAKVWGSEERDEKGRIFAHQVKLKFEKNKAGQLPANPILFRLRYDGTGIDNDHELFSVAELNGLIQKFKRKYNFVKPGTDELLKESLESFPKEDFAKVIKANPDIEKMIMDFIEQGSFYSPDDIKEDDPDSNDDEVEKKTEETTEGTEEITTEGGTEETVEGKEKKDSWTEAQRAEAEKIGRKKLK